MEFDLATYEGCVQDSQHLMDSGLRALLPVDLKSGEVSIMPPMKGAPYREAYYVPTTGAPTIRYRRLDSDGSWSSEELEMAHGAFRP